ALEAGAHVIVEKPMAPSLEECDRMLAAQRRSGRLLSVVAQNRFRDDMAQLKAVLDSGRVGRIAHARIASEWWRGHSYYDLWWRGTWSSEGGGPTLNHAIHHIDLSLWLLGRPQAVAAMITNAGHDNAEVEDLSVAILQYERGLAELTSSVVHHGEQQEIVIQGEHARISQPWAAVAERARPNGFPETGGNAQLVAELDALAAQQAPLEHTGHAGQLGDVIAAIGQDRAPLVDGEAGKRAIELVTAIYAAAIERRTIDLPIDPEDPWYRSGTLVDRAPHFFAKTASVDSQDGESIVGPTHQQPPVVRSRPGTRPTGLVTAHHPPPIERIPMSASEGANYAPAPMPKPVVEPGEFVFAAMHLDHGHIGGMTQGLIDAGGTLKWVYDRQPERAQAFQEKFPQVQIASSEEDVLADEQVHLVAAAAIPSDRAPLGIRVMEAGKDYFTDKTPLITREQLAAAKEAVE